MSDTAIWRGSMGQRVSYGRKRVVEAHFWSARARGAPWVRLADEDYDAIVAAAVASMEPADLRAAAERVEARVA